MCHAPFRLTFWGGGAHSIWPCRLNDYFRLWLIWAHRYSRCATLFFRTTFTRWPNCLPNLIAMSVICAGQLTSVTIGRQAMELEGRTFTLWSCTLSFTGLQLSNQCIWLMVTKLQSSEPTFPFFEATYLGGGVSKHLRANHKVISALFGQHH